MKFSGNDTFVKKRREDVWFPEVKGSKYVYQKTP